MLSLGFVVVFFPFFFFLKKNEKTLVLCLISERTDARVLKQSSYGAGRYLQLQ